MSLGSRFFRLVKAELGSLFDPISFPQDGSDYRGTFVHDRSEAEAVAVASQARPDIPAGNTPEGIAKQAFITGDYYRILGVSYYATQLELRAAFHRLAKIHHPDRVADQLMSEQARERMKMINEAYHCLKDANRRASYNIKYQFKRF